eukprot:SAG31_NODE_11459_length_1027_cov_96.506466_1_plen_97_part_10
MAATTPASFQALLDWIKDSHGPGRTTFTKVVDAQLRVSGVPGFTGPQPDPWLDHHAGAIWLVISRLPEDAVKITDVTIGDTVYCDDTALADVQATTK